MRRKVPAAEIEWMSRYGLEPWRPDAGVVQAARERTADLIALFHSYGGGSDDLVGLVQSAYLQGLLDAADAAEMMEKKDR